MTNSLKITRQWIEKGCHGKWDLVETIFSKEKLLHYKTKVLSWELQFLLEIPPEEFPAASFYKWVQRYRKRYAVKTTVSQNKDKEYEDVANRGAENRVADDRKKKTGEMNINDAWRNFQPTDPDTLKKTEVPEPLLAKVIPNKNT